MNVVLPRGAYYGQPLRAKEVAGLMLTEKVHRRGDTTPRHAHSFPYLCLVIEGSWDERYDGGSRRCTPHTVIYHPAGEVHSDDFRFNAGRLFAIELGQHWLERIGGSSRVLQEPRVFTGGPVPWAARRICDESRRLDHASALVIEGLMLEVLGTAARVDDDRSVHPAPRWLAIAEEILRAEYRSPPALRDLAQAVGVHPVHLARAFRARHGYGAGEYVASLRVEQACRLMTDTAQSLGAIALDVGFADQSHFTRTFSRIMGTTPARYRAS